MSVDNASTRFVFFISVDCLMSSVAQPQIATTPTPGKLRAISWLLQAWNISFVLLVLAGVSALQSNGDRSLYEFTWLVGAIVLVITVWLSAYVYNVVRAFNLGVLLFFFSVVTVIPPDNGHRFVFILCVLLFVRDKARRVLRESKPLGPDD